MQYIHVRNLEKYNPGYIDRSLIWCKVYFKMINSDVEFEMLCEIDKWRFIAFIMIELQMKKPIPISNEYLSRKGFNLKTRKITETIKCLHNLLEVVETNNVTYSSEERNGGVTQSRVDKSRVDKSRVDKSRIDKSRVYIESRFTPPSFSEVSKYIKDKDYTVDASNFISFYESKGWMIGKNKMKSWEAAVRTWHGKNNKETNKKNPWLEEENNVC